MKPTTPCYLCRSCANFIGRPDAERRREHPRLCAAKLVMAPREFACDSFVPRPSGTAALRSTPGLGATPT